MTISDTSRRSGPYPTNGSTTSFPVDFQFLSEDDLIVIQKTVADGTETTLVLNTDYTVTQDTGTGARRGDVTISPALATGYEIYIVRTSLLKQSVDLRNQGEYLPETIEDALDRAILLAQEAQDQLDRGMKLKETDYGVASTDVPTPEADSAIVWNAAGTALANKPISELVSTVLSGNVEVDEFNAPADFTAGVTTQLVLSFSPGTASAVSIDFDGEIQAVSGYTVNDKTVTFSSPITAGTSTVQARYVQGLPSASPGEGSVGTTELADGAVTTDKLASLAVTLAKMADNSVGTNQIVADAVTTNEIADGGVATTNLADDAVSTAKIQDSAVGADQLAAGVFTTAKIADDAVTNAKIAAGAVDTTELANAAVTTNKIEDGAITQSKLAPGVPAGGGGGGGFGVLLSDYASLSAAITAIGSTETILIINQNDSSTTDVSVPANVTLFGVKGAVIDGVRTLTIAGAIMTGAWPMFGSSITVTGRPKTANILPQWFGVVANGTTDDTAAIQRAEDACNAFATYGGGSVRMRLHFPDSNYAITGSINKKAYVDWTGTGTILRSDHTSPTGAAFALVEANAVDNWRIDGLSFINCSHADLLSVPLTYATSVGNHNTIIDAYDCEQWAVTNVLARKFSQFVHYRSGGNFLIQGCRVFSDCGKTVASMESGTYTGLGMTDSTGGIVSAQIGGSAPAPAKHYRIIGNEIEIPGLDICINGCGFGYDRAPCVIANNITRGGNCGVQVYRGSIADPGGAPTYQGSTLVANNHCYMTWYQGIYTRGVVGTTIIGNIFERSGGGGADGNASACGICIRVNPFTAGSSPYKSGNDGDVSNDHPTVIIGNRVINHGVDDASCDAAVLIENDNVLFKGNTITRAAEDYTTARGYAIYVANGKKLRNAVIDDNKIMGKWTVGIQVGDIAKSASFDDYLRITRNQLEGTFTSGVVVEWYSFNVQINENRLLGSYSTGCVRLRNSVLIEICRNSLHDGGYGIQLASGCLLSSTAKQLTAGSESDTRRRGTDLKVNDNDLWGCTTNFSVTETSGEDATFKGRCSEMRDNLVDGAKYVNTYSGGTPATNEARSWAKGDHCLNSAMATGQPEYKVCTVAGQYGNTANVSTGNTTSGSKTISNVSGFNGYAPGLYLNCTGFSGPVQIVAINTSANTITVDTNASSSQTGVSLNFNTPTFVAAASLA